MMNIATALDNGYTPYAYTMLYSLFSHNSGEDIRVFLLSHDLSPENLGLFRELAEKNGAEIVCLQVDPAPFSPFKKRGWALPAAYRLELPDRPETRNCDRLLYLDGDMIVHGSLSSLYHRDLQGQLLCACGDLTVTENTTAYYAPARDERINRLLREENYFNSGMLLIDMEKWRGFGLSDYLELLEELKGKVVAPDQDLLNVAHEGDWLKEDEGKYNLIAAVAKDYGVSPEEVRAQNLILHYAGDKPWQGGHVHYELERFWWEYGLKTPFAREFLRDYIRSALRDTTIYEGVKEITEQNEKLSRELSEKLERAKELLGRLGGGEAS